MSVSIADLPFLVLPEIAARFDFHQFGLHGVSAICSACEFGWCWGPLSLKKLGRHTPPELLAHRCQS